MSFIMITIIYILFSIDVYLVFDMTRTYVRVCFTFDLYFLTHIYCILHSPHVLSVSTLCSSRDILIVRIQDGGL